MVGGSTIFGADSSSIDTTIPGILQKMIAYNNPNMKINVINAELVVLHQSLSTNYLMIN